MGLFDPLFQPIMRHLLFCLVPARPIQLDVVVVVCVKDGPSQQSFYGCFQSQYKSQTVHCRGIDTPACRQWRCCRWQIELVHVAQIQIILQTAIVAECR